MARGRRAKKTSPGVLRTLLRWTVRPKLLVVVAAVLTVHTALPRITSSLPHLADRAEYVVTIDDIHVTPPPRRVPEEFVDRIVARLESDRRLSILDDDLTFRLAREFERHPWVQRVITVRKAAPGHVRVELQYREPTAFVKLNSGLYPIDSAGILLPPEDFSLADTDRFPLITNIKSLPAGSAGSLWDDEIVIGAARLARILLKPDAGDKPLWDVLGVASIRSPDRADPDAAYQLVTRGGSRIVWGLAPGHDRPGELSAEVKVTRLKKYRRDFGGLDGAQGPLEIDIRHWQEISRRSVASEKSPPRG